MSETASPGKTPMSYWIHTAVYLLLTFGMGYIPSDSIPPLGMSVLGIFIGMLYGWTFIGFIWPSMTSIFALGRLRLFPHAAGRIFQCLQQPGRYLHAAYSGIYRLF